MNFRRVLMILAMIFGLMGPKIFNGGESPRKSPAVAILDLLNAQLDETDRFEASSIEADLCALIDFAALSALHNHSHLTAADCILSCSKLFPELAVQARGPPLA